MVARSAMPTPRTPRDPRAQRGAALAVALLASASAALLGIGILMLSEAETLRAKAWEERARARAAAAGAVQLATSWLALPASAVALPAPDEWRLDLRRGDSDLDGRLDARCDGSREDGRWTGFPLVPANEDSALDRLVARACGEVDSPDLLLESGPTLEAVSRALGGDVVVERITISSGPAVRGARSSLTVTATAAVRRGRLLVGRVTAVGRVTRLPRLLGDEVVLAGGDVLVEGEASVAWGVVFASGDVSLPRLGREFPRSGIPRRADGNPMSWATGGATDWNRGTSERECVLSELIGRSRQGVQVPTHRVTPTVLQDPWLGIRASGRIRVGGQPLGDPETIQPYPYDPRTTTLEDDLSFLLARADATDPLDSGRAAALRDDVRGGAGAGTGLRRFVLAPELAGEPRWRENGRGPARTASEWLAQTEAAPAIAAFVRGSAPPPQQVTIAAARGIVLCEAARVLLSSDAEAPLVPANMPGEPFLDHGIDADHDGVIDPETVGNGRWDADFDGDGRADDVPSDGWELGLQMGPAWFLPHHDADTASMRPHPHEPFLNFEYPGTGGEGPVRVRFRAELDGDAVPVRDLDGDGLVRPGLDRMTTLARDAEGALVTVPAHAHALVVNLRGSVELAPGYQLLGAVRAAGDVVLRHGARIRFDAGLARDGFPSLPLPRMALANLAFPPQGVRPGTAGDEPDDGSPPLPAPQVPSEPDVPRSGPGRLPEPSRSPPRPDAPGDGPGSPGSERSGG